MGFLASTAKTYIRHRGRPTIFLDQSPRMLRMAKARLTNLNRSVPDSMLLVQGDVSRLPSKKDRSIGTITAMNVLHPVDDASGRLSDMVRTMTERDFITLTTPVKSGRLDDRYMDKLGEMEIGAAHSRTAY